VVGSFWLAIVKNTWGHIQHPTISQPYPNHIPTISQPYPNHIQPYLCERGKRVLAYLSFGEAQFFLKKRSLTMAFSFGEERELYVCTPLITVRT